MSAWKKMASMFALSVSAVVLSAACTANVEDPANEQDPSATETGEANEALEESTPVPLSPANAPDRDNWNGGFGRGRYCERRCFRELRYCESGRGFDRGFDRDFDDGFDRGYRHHGRCRSRFERCLDRCRFR